MRAKIFLFHRVTPHRNPLWDPMDPGHFRRVIRHLAGKYDIVPLEQLMDRGRSPSSSRLCAVSFDDGYRDFLESAFPILQEFGVPCSMNVITGCVDSGLPPWTFQLDDCFLRTSLLRLIVDTRYLPEHLHRTEWAGPEERIAYAHRLKSYLKGLPDEERRLLFERFRKAMDDVEPPRDLMLTWDDLRELQRSGVEIGSHSVSHPLFAKMAQPAAIKSELVGSFRRIAECLGTPPAVIAYPGGSHDERVERLSLEGGYRIGLAVAQQEYDDGIHGPFQVPRIELYNESMLKTRLRETGTIELLKRIRRKFG